MKDIGRRLRNRREELGLSVECVQADTKIRRRYIEALEAGQEDPIPGEVYVKGFLRFYANYLGLDGPELVREYNRSRHERDAGEASSRIVSPPPVAAPPAGTAASEPEQEPPLEAPAPKTGSPGASRAARKAIGRAQPSKDDVSGSRPLVLGGAPGSKVRAWRITTYVLLMAVLIVAGGVWYIWTHHEPASDPADGANGIGQNGDQRPPDGDPGGGDQPGGGDPDPPLRWEITGESAELLTYVVYGAPFTVGLEVTTDRCWVKVTVDGRVVLEQTLSPGTTGEWTASDGMSIVLGRPHLVELSLGGNDIGRAGTVDAPRTVRFGTASPP